MNVRVYVSSNLLELCFRPQQGLTIMNNRKSVKEKASTNWFPSPTGVNYYELNSGYTGYSMSNRAFPSPTGVNYYELKVTTYFKKNGFI